MTETQAAELLLIARWALAHLVVLTLGQVVLIMRAGRLEEKVTHILLETIKGQMLELRKALPYWPPPSSGATPRPPSAT